MKYFFLLALISLVSLYTKSYEIMVVNKSDHPKQVIFSDIRLNDFGMTILPGERYSTHCDYTIVNVLINGYNYDGHGYGDVIYTINKYGDLKFKKT